MIFRYLFTVTVLFIFSCQAMAEDELVSRLISSKLQDEVSLDGQDIEVKYDRPRLVSRLNQKEDLIDTVKITSLNRQNRKFVAIISLHEGQKEQVSGRYISLVDIPIAASFIQFGEVVEPHMLSSVKIRQDRLKKNLMSSAKEIVGMQAKQNISSGAFIRKIDLQKQTVVKKNDPVNIVYHSGAINLKTKGIAIDSGAVGDVIKARNDLTGAAVIGRIVNQNTIKVNEG